MKMKTMAPLILLSAIFVAPASANFFHNPVTGVSLNVGSAPNPKPEDLRAIGDASYAFDARSDTKGTNTGPNSLHPMQGKMVFGPHAENLGVVMAVDDLDNVVLLGTPSGMHVTVSAQVLSNDGNKIVAAEISPARLMNMAGAQNGTTVVFNNGRWTR
jgi:hypothetical protein